MKQKQYKVLGHEVNYNVPENSEEFNKLDPKRPDAACEEATANIVYRSMNPDTRYWFLHGITEAEQKALAEKGITLPTWAGVETESGIPRETEVVKGKDGKARVKDGVEVTKFTESEEVYYNRVIASEVESKKFASEEAARAHYDPHLKAIALAVPFDITASESKARGPKKLAIKYKEAAAVAIVNGKVDALNQKFSGSINKTFTASGDTTKMYEGKATIGEAVVPFNVSDKDAETLGWLIKEYREWVADNEVGSLVG